MSSKIQYVCSEACGYTSSSYFGLCPRCKEGVGEKSEIKTAKPKPARKSSPDRVPGNYKIQKISDNTETEEHVVKSFKYPEFNRILSTSSGMVDQQVVAIGALAGVGKSTLFTGISDEETLYISSEESFTQVSNRFKRVNPDTDADFLISRDMDDIIDAIETTDKKMIILDSLNGINNGLDGLVKQSQNMVEITQTIKDNDKIALISCHTTRGGEITGMNTLLHAVDTVLYLEHSPVSSSLIMYSNKNRFAETGSISIFEHTPQGLVEIVENDTNGGMGTTLSPVRFGFKNMKIGIEALVVPADGNYGLRKVNGVNQNRVQQILGILGNNGPVRFSDKDVYVSVTSGLTVQDTMVDLAIANSILSSYFQVEPVKTELSGEISLNGRIRNSSEYNHIGALIRDYKKER